MSVGVSHGLQSRRAPRRGRRPGRAARCWRRPVRRRGDIRRALEGTAAGTAAEHRGFRGRRSAEGGASTNSAAPGLVEFIHPGLELGAAAFDDDFAVLQADPQIAGQLPQGGDGIGGPLASAPAALNSSSVMPRSRRTASASPASLMPGAAAGGRLPEAADGAVERSPTGRLQAWLRDLRGRPGFGQGGDSQDDPASATAAAATARMSASTWESSPGYSSAPICARTAASSGVRYAIVAQKFDSLHAAARTRSRLSCRDSIRGARTRPRAGTAHADAVLADTRWCSLMPRTACS